MASLTYKNRTTATAAFAHPLKQLMGRVLVSTRQPCRGRTATHGHVDDGLEASLSSTALSEMYTRVWGHLTRVETLGVEPAVPSSPLPRLHAIVGVPPAPVELPGDMALELAQTSMMGPSMARSVFQNLLQRQLISSKARANFTQGLLLSAPLLPSTLCMAGELAQQLNLSTGIYCSTVGASRVHLLVSHAAPEPDPERAAVLHAYWAALLRPALSGLQPLSTPQLQAARHAESTLREQLRLFDAATWSMALQRLVKDKHKCGIAVRCLMTSDALDAACSLCNKHSLQCSVMIRAAPVPQSRAEVAGAAVATSTTHASRRRLGKRRPEAQPSDVSCSGEGDSCSSSSNREDSGTPHTLERVLVVSLPWVAVPEGQGVPPHWFTD